MAWIRDYPRLFKPEFSRKDFVKNEGGEGEWNYPLPLHRRPFHLTKYFSVKGKGIVGIGDYPLPPFTDNLVILRNGSIVCKQKHGECAASEVLRELAFCP